MVLYMCHAIGFNLCESEVARYQRGKKDKADISRS